MSVAELFVLENIDKNGFAWTNVIFIKYIPLSIHNIRQQANVKYNPELYLSKINIYVCHPCLEVWIVHESYGQ